MSSWQGPGLFVEEFAPVDAAVPLDVLLADSSCTGAETYGVADATPLLPTMRYPASTPGVHCLGQG